jgi:serine/threonine protein kinase
MILADLLPALPVQGRGQPTFNAALEPYPGYHLRRFLGRGGCGEVWEAQKPDGRRVALKLMQCGANNAAAEEIRSIQLMRNLMHPNLLRVERVWAYRSYLVIAMELADICMDGLLQAYQAKFDTPIAPEHVCLCLAQVAEVLDFCNRQQHQVNGQCVAIQHCDVKPNNFLLCGTTVKLSDFGLASTLSSPWKTHRRGGTLDYAAPEVFRGQLSDRTDQYALAVSYCLLRGGRLPFRDTPRSFRRDYVRPAPDLSMLSDKEKPLIARALSPFSQDRWPSCSELIDHLTTAVS